MAKFWFYVAYVLCGVLWVVTLFSVGSEGTYTKTYWLGKKTTLEFRYRGWLIN